MRVLLPVMLLGLLMVGGTGLVFLQKSLASGDLQIDPIGDTAIGTALSMVVSDVTGNNVIRTEGDLRGFMPAAPDGWTARVYEQADGTAITGTEMIRTAISKSTTNNILMDFARDVGVQKGAEVFTYENGDLKMALRMRLLDRFNERTLRGGIMASLSANMSGMDFGGSGSGGRSNGLFAKLDGIDFIQKPRFSKIPGVSQDMPVNYRNFVATVGQYIKIQLITNASDADVAALLSGIDMNALNAMLPETAPEFRAGIGWQVASTEPLSTVPPGQSTASKAYDIMNDGRIYPADETRMLSKLASGDWQSWDDLRDDDVPTDNVLALLGPEPDERIVKRLAAQMGNQDNLDSNMRSVLYQIERGSISSQAELYANSVFGVLEITPEFRNLMGMLPVGEIVPVAPDAPRNSASAETNTGPVIRRGVAVSGSNVADSCTIELGVRRCVIGSDG